MAIFHTDTDSAFHLFYRIDRSISSILLKWNEGTSRLTLILTMAGAPCTYLGHNKASCGAMRNCIDSSTSWKFSLAAGTSGSENQDRSCFHQLRLSSEPTVCLSGDWTLSDVCLKVSEAGWKNFWHFLPSNNFLSPKKTSFGPTSASALWDWMGSRLPPFLRDPIVRRCLNSVWFG